MNFIIQFILRAVNRVGPAVASAKGALASLFSAAGKGIANYAKKGFTAAAAIRFLKGSMEESLNRAKQFTNLAERMGMTAEQVAELDRAAEKAGISVTTIGKGMIQLQKFGTEGLEKSTERGRKLTAVLGLTSVELNKVRKGGMEAYAEMARQIQKIPNESQRTYIWTQLLGESYQQMKGILDMTPESIENLNKDQVRMSEDTTNGVTRLQRVWGDLWASVSVGVGELLEALEPLLAFIGGLLVGAVHVLRMGIQALGGTIDVVMLVAFGLLRVLGQLFGQDDWVKTADAGIKNYSERLVNRVDEVKKQYEDLEETTSNAEKSIMKEGTGSVGERARLLNDDRDDKRSAEDIHNYIEQQKVQRKAFVEQELALQPEQHKLRLLKEQLEVMDEQVDKMKERYGTGYKETKQYLEYLTARRKQEAEIYKAEMAHKDRLRARETWWMEFRNKRTLDIMDKEMYWEEDIFKQTVDNKMNMALRLQQEIEDMSQRQYQSEEELDKKRQELAEKLHDIEMSALDERNRVREMSATIGAVSNIQKVGGGGAFMAYDYSKAQLMATQNTNFILERIEKILSSQAMGAGAGYYRGAVPRYGNSKLDSSQ